MFSKKKQKMTGGKGRTVKNIGEVTKVAGFLKEEGGKFADLVKNTGWKKDRAFYGHRTENYGGGGGGGNNPGERTKKRASVNSIRRSSNV